jgi:hypothetical protein
MKTLSVKEIRTYLIKDTPDDELMQTYGLSPEELQALYEQLIRAMSDGSLYVRIGHEIN